MFDPEKVERVTANACFPNDPDGEGKWWDYVVVQEEDYDQLLELYRNAMSPKYRCDWCGAPQDGPDPEDGARIVQRVCAKCVQKYRRETDPAPQASA